MRVKVGWRMASKENYQLFCQEKPNIKLSFLEWSNIIYSFNYGLRDYALETGEIVKFPWGLGEFVISKKKIKRFKTAPDGTEYVNLNVDWAKTRKAGKRIFHLNHHTNGFSFKWKWFFYTARFKHHKLWVFKPSRVSSRLIAHYISQNYSTKYKEWHNIKR